MPDIRSGGAYVEISAREAALARGLRRAQALLAGFAANVRSLGAAAASGISRIGVGMGIAGAAGAAIEAVFAKTGSALLDISLRTGATVESLSALSYAAKQTGTSMEAVESSMRRAQRTIGDAAAGDKTAAEALSRLGLTYDDLRGKSPDEQFSILADRVGRIADPTLRASAAMEVFGRSGTQLLPLIAEHDALLARARELGVVMSTEEAQSADRVGDAFDDLWLVGTRVAQVVGNTMAPAFLALLDGLTNAGTVVIGMVQNSVWLQSAFASLGQFTTTVFVGIGEVVSAVAGSAGESIVGGIGGAVEFAQTAFQALIDATTTAFAASIYAAQNWQDVSGYAVLYLSLAVVRFGNQVGYFFGTVVPSYLQYLWDNWRNIFQTITDFTASIIGNLAINLYNFFEAVVGWLSGEGFDFTWTGLLDGFESSMEAMPAIAEREIGGLEKELAAELGDLGNKISDDYEATRERLRKTIDAKRIGASPTVPATVPASRADEISAGVAAAQNRLSVVGTFSGAALGQITGASTIDKQQLDALNRIARNTEGIDQDRFE